MAKQMKLMRKQTNVFIKFGFEFITDHSTSTSTVSANIYGEIVFSYKLHSVDK